MKKIHMVGVLLCLVAVGLVGFVWMTFAMDRRMRENLLHTAQVVASSLSYQNIRNLEGAAADTQSLAYQQLKTQLVEIGRQNPDLSWVYVLGLKVPEVAAGGAGELVFFASSEPEGISLDPALPGLIYGDAPAVMHEIFDDPKSLVFGPYRDQWGQWITGLIPLLDPASGEVIALLGLDVDGSRWRLSTITRSVIPLALLLLLLTVLAAWLVAERTSYDAHAHSLFHRLLYPFASVLLILVICFCFLFTLYQEDVRERSTRQVLEKAGINILLALEEKTNTLDVLAQFLLGDASVMEAFRSGVNEETSNGVRQAIEKMKTFSSVDCVSLLGRDGQMVYPARGVERVLQPWFTLATVRESGEPFAGLEMVPSGDIVYRRVAPVREDGEVIGFISIGRKVWDVVDSVSQRSNLPILVSVKKALLEESALASDDLFATFSADERLVYYSADLLSRERIALIRDEMAASEDRQPVFRTGDKMQRLMRNPIMDAGGLEIGTFRVLVNTNEIDMMRKRSGLLFGTGAISIVMLLFALLYVLVHRADRSISMHQAALEEKTEQSLELAKKANAASIAKTHFLNNISHELRTPINGIMGFASLLETMNLTQDQRSYLLRLTGCSRDLLGVIDNLLQFTQIETGDFELCETHFGLRCVLEPLQRHFSNVAMQKVLSFRWEVDAGVPAEIYGDEICLTEILRNLLANALKFTERGEVVFSVRLQDAADGVGQQLVFTIADTGIGIMPDELDRIFEGFSQVDDSSTRSYGGMGIGLALSRKMACRMGGDIRVKSELGRGSTFTVLLPLRG